MRHLSQNAIAISTMLTLCAVAAPASAQDRGESLEEVAERAVSQRRWVQAAHAYREAATARPSTGLKLREMLSLIHI